MGTMEHAVRNCSISLGWHVSSCHFGLRADHLKIEDSELQSTKPERYLALCQVTSFTAILLDGDRARGLQLHPELHPSSLFQEMSMSEESLDRPASPFARDHHSLYR